MSETTTTEDKAEPKPMSVEEQICTAADLAAVCFEHRGNQGMAAAIRFAGVAVSALVESLGAITLAVCSIRGQTYNNTVATVERLDALLAEARELNKQLRTGAVPRALESLDHAVRVHTGLRD